MKRSALVLIGLLLAALPLLAQSTGSFFGTVTNEIGSRISNADIYVLPITPDRDPCGGGGCGGGNGDDNDGDSGGNNGDNGGGCGGGCGDGDNGGGCGDGDGCGGCGGCRCKSDESGRFEIEDMLPGFYRVTVTVNGYVEAVTVVEVEADHETGMEMIMISDENTVSMTDQSQFPTSAMIVTSYPNPFNSTSSLSIQMAGEDFVEIALYDLSGRQLKSIHNGVLTTGLHAFTVDGSDLNAGTYLVKISSETGVISHSITLAK